MATRTQQSRKGIKQGIDAEDSRRKREEQANGLRKNKREESLQKRRNFGAESNPSSPVVSSLHPHPNSESNTPRLPDLVAGLGSDDPIYIHDSTVRIRKLLSAKKDPPIQEVIQAGAVSRLVHLLTLVSHPQIQFEACWALTNIASGTLDQTMSVVNAGAVPLFVKLLEVPNAEIREQALWALANISGENPGLRDHVLSHNAVDLTLLQFSANPVCFFFLPFVKKKKKPPTHFFPPFLTVLSVCPVESSFW
jgi:importin subunit alpha-1